MPEVAHLIPINKQPRVDEGSVLPNYVLQLFMILLPAEDYMILPGAIPTSLHQQITEIPCFPSLL